MRFRGNVSIGRRDVLRALTAGMGLAVTTAAPFDTASSATEPDSEKSKARYKETDHVKKFYQVNRYPS